MDIKTKVANMTIEEKIAQMVIARGHGKDEFAVSLDKLIREGKITAIGAVAIPERTVEEAGKHINDMLEAAPGPLCFYIDTEWGLAQRYLGATRVPSAMCVGASRSEELAYQNGFMVASECKAMGYHITGSPALDVNTNYKNPIINTRAFSDDTDLVIKLGGAYAKGIQDAGVITCGKHYPGHGDTAEDSHVSMPTVSRDRESVMDIELRPYKELAKDLWGVMTAHIAFPKLANPGEEDLPATLSRKLLYETLRDELGFDGLIISDSLTMRGIKAKYGLEAAVGAIYAGHDMILQDYETDPKETLDILYRAVENGEIPMWQIDESVERILKFKEMVGANEKRPVDIEYAKSFIGCEAHRELAQKTADAGVTMLEGAALPLKNCGKTLVISTVGEEEKAEIRDFGLADGSSSKRVIDEIGKRTPVDYLCVSEHPSDEECAEVLSRAKDCDNVIFASFIRPVAYKTTSGTITENQQKLISTLMESVPNFTFLIFGSPYCLMSLPKMKNCVIGYGDDEYSIRAAVKVIFGEMEAEGKLPVKVGDLYPFGYSYK